MRIKPLSASPTGDLATVASLALMRGLFALFVPQCYRILHPGTPPLRQQWYLLAMFQAFQKAAIGQTRRLVISVPPRHLKSITSVAYAAWLLGRSPTINIMFATYGDRLGREHLENVRRIMAHPFYRLLFPSTCLVRGGIGRGKLMTTEGGGCRSVTVGGASTGFGADVIMIDDSLNAVDINSEAKRLEVHNFYKSTLVTRLNSAFGVIISIQQRLGEDDLPALLLEHGAEHVCLPSYDDQAREYDIRFGRRYRRPIGELLRPNDQTMEFLNERRLAMGDYLFATQYLQQPGAIGGNMVRLERLHRFDLVDRPRTYWERVVQSWDTASSEEAGAAYSVCLTFGRRNGCRHLIHVTRQRLNFPALRDRIVAQRRCWKADAVLIEDADSGRHLYHDLVAQGVRPIMLKPVADKVTRLVGQLAFIEDGRIAIPNEASWLAQFLHELRLFPASKYADQVDALAQFCEWAKSPRIMNSAPRDPETGRRLWVERRR